MTSYRRYQNARQVLQVLFILFFHNLLWLTVLTEDREERSLSVSSSVSVLTSKPEVRTKFDEFFESRDLVRGAMSQETGEILRSPRLPIELAELRPSEGIPNCLCVPSFTSRSNSTSRICRA